MNKKLLVIGAGIAQVDGIKKAKDIGYTVYATDASPYAPGFSIADYYKVIDVYDTEKSLEWAKTIRIDGVTSYATDVALQTVLKIRQALNLPGLNSEPVRISLNKELQRKVCYDASIAQPEFVAVSEFSELKEMVKNIGFPLVLKPTDNSGSRGISLIKDMDGLEDAFDFAISNSTSGRVIAEQYIEGTELSIESISINHKHHILAIGKRFKPDHPFSVASQIVYTENIDNKTKKKITILINNLHDAVGVDNSPTHTEIILTKEGPKFLEIGCRGGGFFIFTQIVQAVSGYDIVGNWTKFCMGDPIDVPCNIQEKGAVLRYFVATPGKLLRVEGLEKALMDKDVICGGLFIKPGELVPKLRDDGSRTGWIITRGENNKEALKSADIVNKIVKFHNQ